MRSESNAVPRSWTLLIDHLFETDFKLLCLFVLFVCVIP